MTMPSAAAGATGNTVLAAWIETLVRYLSANGFDGMAMARSAGIAPDAFEHPGARIPQQQVIRFWKDATATVGDPCIGIEVSRFTRPATFHSLGPAVLASGTLRNALERIARYGHIVHDLSLITTQSTETRFLYIIGQRRDVPQHPHEAIDAILGAIVRAARFLDDRSVAPEEVWLTRPEPAQSERFTAFFRCPVRFGAMDSRLIFDAAVVDRKLPVGNQELAGAIDETITSTYLNQLEGPNTTTRQMRDVLIDLLPAGIPSTTVVARALGTSPRTLQRCLQDEGTTFRDEFQRVRIDLACAYLADRSRSISEIGHLIGFSEPAAFSRAFKRWTGQCPSGFRARAGRPPPTT
jgi:AraC-like DNA-binding protein